MAERLILASERIDIASQLLRSEYLARPDLLLTPGETAEILELDRGTSVTILQALVESGFLRLSHDGRFGLATSLPANTPRRRDPNVSERPTHE